MTKNQIREENTKLVQEFILNGGEITKVRSAHNRLPKNLKFSKHCGKTNCFGIRV